MKFTTHYHFGMSCITKIRCIFFTEDIALDWVNNKLYWTETFYRRIEVLDLDTLVIVPILRVDINTGIRGIALDPYTRYCFLGIVYHLLLSGCIVYNFCTRNHST